MNLKAKCVLCDEVLEYVRSDTKNLIDHVLEKHGDSSLDHLKLQKMYTVTRATSTADNRVEEQEDEDEEETSRDNFEQKLLLDPNTNKTIYQREYRPFRVYRQIPRCSVLFKTTIEKWRPGGGRISCPSCGNQRIPVIRSHTDTFTESPFVASLSLHCWPFCCLPCLFPPPNKEYLHCSVCEEYLAFFDHRTGKIMPNCELLDDATEQE
jgi:hypothetical protein